MTFTEFLLRAAGKFKPIKKISQSACRYAVTKPRLRRYLNKFYNRMSYNERVYFHYLFSAIFRNRKAPLINGVWHIKFNNKTIGLPLQTETLWLDWDLAISIVGHDVEIKSFYEKLIRSFKRPIHFFDVGANYGTHSLLFLSQGMGATTFEPNPECWPIFQRFLQINSFKGQLENVAVGAVASKAELVFPKNDTWNGSLHTEYQNELVEYQNLTRISVDIVSLDDYIAQRQIKPDVIKIDTEGFELNVIKGARRILSELHPVVVFESNKPNERPALYQELSKVGYQVYDIEEFFSKRLQLKEHEFVHSKQVNFVGLSKETTL